MDTSADGAPRPIITFPREAPQKDSVTVLAATQMESPAFETKVFGSEAFSAFQARLRDNHNITLQIIDMSTPYNVHVCTKVARDLLAQSDEIIALAHHYYEFDEEVVGEKRSGDNEVYVVAIRASPTSSTMLAEAK